MPVTVSRPINGLSINGDEHLLDESGEVLGFETVKEAVRFFADRNFTITDLLGLDFHFEGRMLPKPVSTWKEDESEEA
jgi:hypothetical protein